MTQSTVVITGANRGIGLELTRTYLKSGNWKIYACCRSPQSAENLIGLETGSHGKIIICPLDVTDARSVEVFSKKMTGVRVDLLLNNAGIMGGDRQSVLDMDFDQWMEAFKVNTMAPLRMVQAMISNLKLSKNPKIVTISSQMGSLSLGGLDKLAYRSTKAAVNKAMQVVSLDLAKEGMTVVLLHPGWVQTDMGGTSGEITAEESASGILDVISSLKLSDTGRFLKWTGEDHPW